MFDLDKRVGGDSFVLRHDQFWSLPTLVGEAPSQHSNPARPFFSASGVRLAEWAGMSGFEELERRAFLKNLLPKWPGPGHRGEKGSRFPITKAKKAAKKIATSRVVVMVGARVAKAFEFEFRGQPFTWAVLRPSGPGRLTIYGAYMPHPSGTNRFYHDVENRLLAMKFLRSVFAKPSMRCEPL